MKISPFHINMSIDIVVEVFLFVHTKPFELVFQAKSCVLVTGSFDSVLKNILKNPMFFFSPNP